jgi:hypothetical protein
VRWREKLKKKNYSKGQLKKVVKKNRKRFKNRRDKSRKNTGK